MTKRGMSSALGSFSLFICLSFLGVTGSPAQAPPRNPKIPKLYVLLVADTNSNLREHLEVDRDNLTRVLKEGFANRPHRLILTVLEGDPATPDNIITHYQKLKDKVTTSDTLLFYYTGHGDTDPDEGHRLTLVSGHLLRKDLRSAMKAVPHRQLILLTDSCSKVRPPTRMRGKAVRKPPAATWPVMDCLFFHHAGVTDINGCQADAFSWCYVDDKGKAQGGTFTLALVPLLCAKFKDFEPDTTFVTWGVFSKRLRRDTDVWFQRARKAATDADPNHPAGKQDKQDPEVFSLATKAPQLDIQDNIWIFGAEFTNARSGTRPVVILLKVYPGLPADKAEFKKGDLILTVDGQSIKTREEFSQAIEYSQGKITIGFRRGETTFSKDVELKRVKPPAAPE